MQIGPRTWIAHKLAQTVHGYDILDRKPSTACPGSEIVSVHLPHNSVTPFVVWRMEPETGICEGGDYCADLERLGAAFVRRS